MLLNRYFNLSTTPLAGAGTYGITTPFVFYTVEGSPITIAAGGQTAFAAQVMESNAGSGSGTYVNVMCMSDQASAANGLALQMSSDQGATWHTVAATALVANVLSTLRVLIACAGSQWRVQLTNGATPQTYLILGASISET